MAETLNMEAYELIVVVVLAVFFYLCAYPLVFFIIKQRRIRRVLLENFPESYKGQFHWLHGHLKCLPKSGSDKLQENLKQVERYPKARVFCIGGLMSVLILSHPDTAKEIFHTHHPKRELTHKIVKNWLGDGLVFSQGSKWNRNRRLLTPAFHFNILKSYIQIYNRCVEKLMSKFQTAASQGKRIEIFGPISLFTFEVIMKCAFTSPKEFQAGQGTEYVNAIHSILKISMKRIFAPLLHPDWIFNRTKYGEEMRKCCELTRGEALKVIAQRRSVIKEKGEEAMLAERKYVDFLDTLLLAKDDDGRGMSDKEITDEVQTFMFAGMDTTKSALSLLLYNLARHPEVQTKARQEVAAILKGRESDEILWEDLSKMEYLSKCVKESLRMHPPVPQLARTLSEDIKIDGRTVLAGTNIHVVMWEIHHNPTVWGDDHMSYKPERFDLENMAKMDPFAFVPFSAGPRNCIGQHFALNEIKVAAARIINKFEISVDETVPVEIKAEIVLVTENGIHLIFNSI